MSAELIYNFITWSEFIATGASISGIVMQFYSYKKLKKTIRNDKASMKRIRKKKIITFSIVLLYGALGAFLIFSFKERIQTYIQEGSFKNYYPGLHEIKYKCAYKSKPYLYLEKIDKIDGDFPILQNQSVDGFTVRIYPTSSAYKWIAIGLPQECKCK